jgi:hypothetical protein
MNVIITKVSGVLFVQNSVNTNPKSYFGYNGSYRLSDNDIKVVISIGTDLYNCNYSDLIINSQVPSTPSEAKTLLNSIFGS